MKSALEQQQEQKRLAEQLAEQRRQLQLRQEELQRQQLQQQREREERVRLEKEREEQQHREADLREQQLREEQLRFNTNTDSHTNDCFSTRFTALQKEHLSVRTVFSASSFASMLQCSTERNIKLLTIGTHVTSLC